MGFLANPRRALPWVTMKGTLLIYQPFVAKPEVGEFDAEPDFSILESIVGGHLEMVPGFFTIEYNGAVHRCVAFSDVNGKRKGLSLNRMATVLWDSALRREMGIGLIRQNGTRADHLVGPVAILFANPHQ
jgi:hypothetical protein